jgi:mono/diheme cytochrome c family protein
VHLRKNRSSTNAIKPKETDIYKTTPRVALFASAYLYYSNPTTSSTTNYLPISEIQQNAITKSMDDGKEVYADFCIQCHQANEKGMALISRP